MIRRIFDFGMSEETRFEKKVLKLAQFFYTEQFPRESLEVTGWIVNFEFS